MLPEVSTTDQISPTDARVQGNLLREYEQKFVSKVLLKCVLTPFCVRVDLGADLSGRLRGRPRTP